MQALPVTAQATILALDLGRKTGWAVMELDEGDVMLRASGIWQLDGEGTALPALHLKEHVKSTIRLFEPDLLAAEAPNIMPTQSMESRRMAFGLSVQVEIESIKSDLQLKLVSTQAIKGMAARFLDEKLERKGKAQCLRAAERMLGRKPHSDDEADAVMCALWAADQLMVVQ